MKKNLLKHRIGYLILHQVLIITMTISIYAYDYIILRNPERNEIGYLLIAIVSFLGAMGALWAYIRTEKVIAKKRKRKSLIDRLPVEVMLLISGIVFVYLMKMLQSIKVENFFLAGLIVTVATLIFLIDNLIVRTYVSVYDRYVTKRLKNESLLYFVWQLCTNYESGRGLQELTRRSKEQAKIQQTLELIADGQLDVMLDTQEFHGQERAMAVSINRIQEGLKEAVESRIRDERMKADLITNVSHDIKTPLTSIVNYVELLRREKLDNENANHYIRIIEEKSQRLKTLTEDLVEVSKISSGNIQLDLQTIDFLELLYQTGGEFNERFVQRNLTIVTKLPSDAVYIKADGRQLYRALENLYTNAAKYALEDTKVYVDLTVEKKQAIFTIRNISKAPLAMQSGRYTDLTERFVRGEVSRTTEGSGLGLSIAKNLTTLMDGKFNIRIEGELFTAQIIFPVENTR